MNGTFGVPPVQVAETQNDVEPIQNKIDEFGECSHSCKINDMSSADSDSQIRTIRIPTKRMPLKVTSSNVCHAK